MTARTTLTSVLTELKTLCDLTVITEASVDYGHFDDDSLQTALDKWGREEILDWQLVPMPRMVNGSKTTLTYLFPTLNPAQMLGAELAGKRRKIAAAGAR